MSTRYADHPRLGRVALTPRANSHRISARWKEGMLHVSLPRGVTPRTITDFLDQHADRLLAMRPHVAFLPGERLVLPDLTIEFRRQRLHPRAILATPSLPRTAVEIGAELDLADPSVMRHINTILLRLGRALAPAALLPHARRLADATGLHPTAWRISGGHHTLGTCNAQGIISLSYLLLFLPADLRDYIILHELAHLRELNHSERFHRLLDGLLQGREQQLAAHLKAFDWPILRR